MRLTRAVGSLPVVKRLYSHCRCFTRYIVALTRPAGAPQTL